MFGPWFHEGNAMQYVDIYDFASSFSAKNQFDIDVAARLTWRALVWRRH